MTRETRQLTCALFLLLALSAFALPATAEPGTALTPVFQAQPDQFPGQGNSCRIPPPFQPESCICPLFFDPVCGCDGQTYSNACFARCEVRSFTPGACE